MPEKLKDYLESLPNSEAELIWKWLDDDPAAVQTAIEVLADSHSQLAKRMQGRLYKRMQGRPYAKEE